MQILNPGFFRDFFMPKTLASSAFKENLLRVMHHIKCKIIQALA